MFTPIRFVTIYRCVARDYIIKYMYTFNVFIHSNWSRSIYICIVYPLICDLSLHMTGEVVNYHLVNLACRKSQLLYPGHTLKHYIEHNSF